MVPPETTTEHPSSANELMADIERLEARLQDGERRIEEATRIGADTEAWEHFWIELLHSFENVYRRLADSAEGGA